MRDCLTQIVVKALITIIVALATANVVLNSNYNSYSSMSQIGKLTG